MQGIVFSYLYCNLVLTFIANFHFPQNVYHHYSSWLNFTLSAEGQNSTKLTAQGVFWFHACLPSPAMKQLSPSSVAFGVTREIFSARSIWNVIDTKCRHIVTEVQFRGKGIYFHFH